MRFQINRMRSWGEEPREIIEASTAAEAELRALLSWREEVGRRVEVQLVAHEIENTP